MVFAHDQLMRSKTLIIVTTISSFTRVQKVVSHTAAHYRIGVCTWPTLRGAKHFNSTSYFLYAWFVYTACIVDLPFRIMTCRFLLAIVSRTWDLVCINLSFASRNFVCPRSTVSAFHCVRANDLDFAFCIGTYRRGHHALRGSSCVSLAHGPRWLFLLSRHRKAFLLLLIRSLL